MNNAALMDPVWLGFRLAEHGRSTEADGLTHERQSRIYLSEIKRTLEVVGQPSGFTVGSSQDSFLHEGVSGSREQLKQSNWLEGHQAIELLPRLYIRSLLHSWRCGPEIDGLISRIRQNIAILHAELVAQRLNHLWNMSDVENAEADECVISSDSLRSFERFSSIYPRMRYPDITLTPGGDVYARWKGTDKSLLSIQFLPEMRVRFVVFAPNQRHPEELNRASGNDLVDTVISNLDKAYGVSRWVLE